MNQDQLYLQFQLSLHTERRSEICGFKVDCVPTTRVDFCSNFQRYGVDEKVIIDPLFNKSFSSRRDAQYAEFVSIVHFRCQKYHQIF